MEKYAAELRVFPTKGVNQMNCHYKNSIGEVWTATGYVMFRVDTAIKLWRIQDNRRRLEIYQMVTLDLMALEDAVY